MMQSVLQRPELEPLWTGQAGISTSICLPDILAWHQHVTHDLIDDGNGIMN